MRQTNQSVVMVSPPRGAARHCYGIPRFDVGVNALTLERPHTRLELLERLTHLLQPYVRYGTQRALHEFVDGGDSVVFAQHPPLQKPCDARHIDAVTAIGVAIAVAVAVGGARSGDS